MKPERVEDLGKLSIMLKNIIDHELFEQFMLPFLKVVRKKDFPEWFKNQSEDKREDILLKLIYGLDDIFTLIYECRAIADGDDE